MVIKKENKKPIDYFIIPAKIVSKSIGESHKKWLKKGNKDNTIRAFRTKPSKMCPKWFTQELIDSFKNNIEVLNKYQ